MLSLPTLEDEGKKKHCTKARIQIQMAMTFAIKKNCFFFLQNKQSNFACTKTIHQFQWESAKGSNAGIRRQNYAADDLSIIFCFGRRLMKRYRLIHHFLLNTHTHTECTKIPLIKFLCPKNLEIH